MSFSIEEYIKKYPLLFHLTSQENLKIIRKDYTLYSASTLIRRAGTVLDISSRRKESLTISIEGQPVIIRDQKPLIEANIAFDLGWNISKLITELNQRVYFWPGDETGPVLNGRSHYKRYQEEDLAILRIEVAKLIENNPPGMLYFCKYNSGSPRQNQGKGSPRGANSFVWAHQAHFKVSEIVEVSLKHKAILPRSTEIAPSYEGPWEPLLPTAPGAG